MALLINSAVMKYILFAAILFTGCKNNAVTDAKMAVVVPKGVVPQALAGDYKGDYGISDDPQPQYSLWARDDIFGTLITFEPTGRFTSTYRADCGNDCFPYCAGRYVWIDSHHICMVADSIRVTGDCDNKEYAPHKDLGVYRVAKQENGIRLTKEVR
jgi:hypothetical protein